MGPSHVAAKLKTMSDGSMHMSEDEYGSDGHKRHRDDTSSRSLREVLQIRIVRKERVATHTNVWEVYASVWEVYGSVRGTHVSLWETDVRLWETQLSIWGHMRAN